MHVGPSTTAREQSPFTDLVLPFDVLNKFLIRSNMFYGHLYRNVINASLMSTKSRMIKSQQIACHDDEKLALDYGRLKPDTADTTLPRVREKVGLTETVSAQPSWSSRENRALEKHNAAGEDSSCPKLVLPNRNENIFTLILLIELILVGICLFISHHLSDGRHKQTFITCSRPSAALKHESIKLEFNLGSLVHANKSNLECVAHAETYLNREFKEFFLWDASVVWDNPNASSRWFNKEREKSEILFEDYLAVQLTRREIKLYSYLLACFLLICFVSCLIAGRFPYDVTPLVLIYDPESVAFTIRLRLNHHLGLMRQSYMNFWSIYRLNKFEELVSREFLSPSESDRKQRFDDRNGSGPTPAALVDTEQENSQVKVVDSICLNCRQFDGYMPTARGQSWRRVLILVHPAMQYIMEIIVLLSILGIWLEIMHANSSGAFKNMELRSFLLGANDHQELARIQDKCQHEMDMSSMRKFVAQTCASSLRQRDANVYKMRRENYLNSSFSLLAREPSWSPPREDEIDLRIVADTLAPTKTLLRIYWLMPVISMPLPSILTTLYMSIIALTLSDLCFWIVELRLKLQICAFILENYQLFKIDIHPKLSLRPQLAKPSRKIGTAANRSSSTTNSNQHSQLLDPVNVRQPGESRHHHLDKTIVMLSLQVNRLCPSTARNYRSECRNEHSRQQRSEIETVEGSAGEAIKNSLCNIPMKTVIVYLFASRKGKLQISETHAKRLICLDLIGPLTPRRETKKFLTSTYLDFRLFLDQIEDCRNTINYFIGYTIFLSSIIIAASISLNDRIFQIGFLLIGFLLANISLVSGGFFQSQCSKLYAPIHSMLALCLQDDKVVIHLASLWRRLLIDLCGSRTRLSFRVYSLNISYAFALQVLSVSILYCWIDEHKISREFFDLMCDTRMLIWVNKFYCFVSDEIIGLIDITRIH